VAAEGGGGRGGSRGTGRKARGRSRGSGKWASRSGIPPGTAESLNRGSSSPAAAGKQQSEGMRQSRQQWQPAQPHPPQWPTTAPQQRVCSRNSNRPEGIAGRTRNLKTGMSNRNVSRTSHRNVPQQQLKPSTGKNVNNVRRAQAGPGRVWAFARPGSTNTAGMRAAGPPALGPGGCKGGYVGGRGPCHRSDHQQCRRDNAVSSNQT